MKLGYIYKITNKVNNKIYIGKTTTSIKQRFREHLYSAKHKEGNYISYLYRAIDKYGQENFSVSLLEEIKFENEKILDDRERYWIKKLHSQDHKIGYNIQEGGEGGAVRSAEWRPSEKQLKALEKASHLPASDKLKRKLKEIRTNCIVSKETIDKLREKSSGRVWVNKEGVNRHSKKEELNTYIQDGWLLGKLTKIKK